MYDGDHGNPVSYDFDLFDWFYNTWSKKGNSYTQELVGLKEVDKDEEEVFMPEAESNDWIAFIERVEKEDELNEDNVFF